MRTKTTVFLIVDDNDQRNELAKGLRDVRYDLHDYMTDREFLIDKRHHMSGVDVGHLVRLWRAGKGSQKMNNLTNKSDAELWEILQASSQMQASLVDCLGDRTDMQNAIARLMRSDDTPETFLFT